MNLRHLISTAVLAVGLLLPAQSRAQEQLSLAVAPSAISIDALYDGTAVSLEGTAPAGSQIVARFVGAPADLHMKEKGKALGLLWMNLDSVTFKGVPSVCLVESSAPLGSLGEAAAPFHAGEALRAVSVEPATADKAAVLPELLKLKQSEGLYRETSGGIAVATTPDGSASFSGSIRIPSRLLPGSYAVEAYAIKDGQIVAQTSQPIQANLVSAPAALASMAFDHAAFYGILATIVAIISGLAVGLVCQCKGAH